MIQNCILPWLHGSIQVQRPESAWDARNSLSSQGLYLVSTLPVVGQTRVYDSSSDSSGRLRQINTTILDITVRLGP